MTGEAPAVVLSHGPGGLGAVRSLGRRGIEVTAIAYDSTDAVCHSRYPAETHRVEGNTDQEKESSVINLLRELPDRQAVILTTSDQMVALVSAHHDELLRKYRFRLPPPQVLEALNDKRKETDLVRSLGFAIPKTVVTVPEDPNVLSRNLRFPIIFKPHLYSVAHVFPLKNSVVRDQGELEAFYAKWHLALPVLIAQEVIPGPDSASWICSCTFDANHALLDCGIKQKLRALPAHFGGSTFAVSRHNDQILDLARELGKKLDYVGHAGIEFRWDERDDEYKYIELNPRLPANVGFDEACGLATVWNSYRVSQGEEGRKPVRKQRDGIYYLDLKGDLRSLQDDGSSRWTALLRLLAILLLKRTSGPYFAWDDPRPGLAVARRFFASYRRAAQQKKERETSDAQKQVN